MPRPAQQPPGACGGPAEPSVVHDHVPVLGHSGRPHGRSEDLHVGQRMAARRSCGGGEFRVQVHVDGPRNVRLLVGGAQVRAAQLPADVQDDRRIRTRQVAREFGCGDDGVHGHHPCARGGRIVQVRLLCSAGPPRPLGVRTRPHAVCLMDISRQWRGNGWEPAIRASSRHGPPGRGAPCPWWCEHRHRARRAHGGGTRGSVVEVKRPHEAPRRG